MFKFFACFSEDGHWLYFDDASHLSRLQNIPEFSQPVHVPRGPGRFAGHEWRASSAQ